VAEKNDRSVPEKKVGGSDGFAGRINKGEKDKSRRKGILERLSEKSVKKTRVSPGRGKGWGSTYWQKKGGRI